MMPANSPVAMDEPRAIRLIRNLCRRAPQQARWVRRRLESNAMQEIIQSKGHRWSGSQAHKYFEDPVRHTTGPVRVARTLVNTHKRVANLKKYIETI